VNALSARKHDLLSVV
jgi:hypothetical protein